MITEKIFELMEEKGISQKELSRWTGIPTSTICDWKKKGNTPSADKIMKICEALDVSPYYLLSGSEIKDNRESNTGYFVLKDSGEGQLIEVYQNLDASMRQRLIGYALALSEKS